MSLTSELWLLFFAALFAGILLGILGYRIWLRSRFRVAIGEIESSRIDTSLRSRSGEKLYGVQIRYRYDVADRRYTGTAITPGYRYSRDEAEQQELLSRYPVGKRVAVYYNPENPSEAYLQYGLPRLLIALLVLALLFLLVVITLLLREIASLERPSPSLGRGDPPAMEVGRSPAGALKSASPTVAERRW